MEGEAGAAVAQLAALTARRDNLQALVARLSILDGLSAGAAALGLLLEARTLQKKERTHCRRAARQSGARLHNWSGPACCLDRTSALTTSHVCLAGWPRMQTRRRLCHVRLGRKVAGTCGAVKQKHQFVPNRVNRQMALQGGDYGAALDVLADLQAGLAGDPLHGLSCFRWG